MEVFRNHLVEIIAIIISIFSLIVAIVTGCKANKKADRANQLAKEANNVAKQANVISLRSEFSEYYNHLHKISKHLDSVLSSLNNKLDIIEAENLMRSLIDYLTGINDNDRKLAFPTGTNGTFSEMHTECIKIQERIRNLKSSVVRFKDFNDKINDELTLTYSVENLSEDTQKVVDNELQIINKKIEEIIKFIVLTLDEQNNIYNLQE